jgi:hypothetical protein
MRAMGLIDSDWRWLSCCAKQAPTLTILHIYFMCMIFKLFITCILLSLFQNTRSFGRLNFLHIETEVVLGKKCYFKSGTEPGIGYKGGRVNIIYVGGGHLYEFGAQLHLFHLIPRVVYGKNYSMGRAMAPARPLLSPSLFQMSSAFWYSYAKYRSHLYHYAPIFVTLVGGIATRHTLTMGVLLKFGFHRGHQVWPSIRNKQLGLREILFLIKQTISLA